MSMYKQLKNRGDWMKRKNLYMTLASLVLFIASFVMIGITFGWFAFMVDLNPGTVSVGDLRYTQSGSFIEDDVIVPGQELLSSGIDLTNESPITSQLRVKIEFTQITNPGGTGLVSETVPLTSSSSDHLEVEWDATSTFVYSDGYWYYSATDAVIAADSGSIPILDSIKYGLNTNIDYVGQAVSISVTIEVKQSDNVTWSELTSYDFSTGYPTT